MPTFLSHFVVQRRQQLGRTAQLLADLAFQGAIAEVEALEAGFLPAEPLPLTRLADGLDVPPEVIYRILHFDQAWQTADVPLKMSIEVFPGKFIEVALPDDVRTAAQGEALMRTHTRRVQLGVGVKKFYVVYVGGDIEKRVMRLPDGSWVPLRITGSDAEDDWLFAYEIPQRREPTRRFPGLREALEHALFELAPRRRQFLVSIRGPAEIYTDYAATLQIVPSDFVFRDGGLGLTLHLPFDVGHGGHEAWQLFQLMPERSRFVNVTTEPALPRFACDCGRDLPQALQLATRVLLKVYEYPESTAYECEVSDEGPA
jgi:hypothetical protein